MRGKKAKLLRRAARAVSAGLPERALAIHADTGQIVNAPKSTRGIYRRWKRLTPKGHAPFTEKRAS